jgi:hypothetical protein
MIDQLKSAICKTVKQFQVHPLDFLSESDIQALLFIELRNATSDLRYPYDGEGKNHRFGFTDPFCIHPVTTEYHVSEGKFDIAVLSKEPDPKSDIWRQPCRVAIEIKLWQPCEREPKYIMDVKKLQRYQEKMQTAGQKFTGIAMLFVHPYKTGVPKDIIEEISPDAYPENGVALHLVTDKGHGWKQCPGPSITE